MTKSNKYEYKVLELRINYGEDRKEIETLLNEGWEIFEKMLVPYRDTRMYYLYTFRRKVESSSSLSK